MERVRSRPEELTEVACSTDRSRSTVYRPSAATAGLRDPVKMVFFGKQSTEKIKHDTRRTLCDTCRLRSY